MMKAPADKKVITRTFEAGTLTVAEGGRTTLSFDFGKLPLPKETYPASSALLRPGPGHDVFLVFAQLDATAGEPKHTLQIKFDDLSLLNTWANSREFFGRLGSWYETEYGVKPSPESLALPGDLPFFQMAATLAFIGHNDATGVIAFYYFDPRTARRVATAPTKGLKDDLIEPVVQVKVNSLVLWRLLAEIEVYVAKLTEQYAPLGARLLRQEQKELDA